MRKISECFEKLVYSKDIVKEYDFVIIFDEEFEVSAIYKKDLSIHQNSNINNGNIFLGDKHIGKHVWLSYFYRRIKPHKDTKEQS